MFGGTYRTFGSFIAYISLRKCGAGVSGLTRRRAISICTLAAAALLSSCSTGSRYYLPTSRGGSALAAVQSTDAIGDQVVTITQGKIVFKITTPKNSDGSIVIGQRAILNKTGTAVLAIENHPLVASSSTSNPVNAIGSAFAKGIQSAATFVGTLGTAIGASGIMIK